MANVFNTDRRIKLGIWGLGRGQSFLKAANSLNIDVVAGCDIHPNMRDTFRSNLPDAFVTGDEDEFLAQDFDVVLIATYLKDHAKHTIKALQADKHILCEVTPFYTVAEGVQLVEAVEKSGKIYNLLENYPFTRQNLFLKKLWDEGLFGEFQYGEFEYLHEARILSYAYNVPGESLPVEPGWTVHNWRAALDCHYYCTHSLGPVMQITGTRPVKVSAMPCNVHLPGMLRGIERQTVCPSMIQMDNGGVVRNLMGSTTGDYHSGERIWGTRASAEKLVDQLKIRIGGAGGGTLLEVDPEWPDLGELASSTGHGGGDFWELYYFARQFLTGEPAPWDVYSAADVTLAGILAVESHQNGGIPLEIPDFRDPAVRERYRNHPAAQEVLDPLHIFPEGHDPAISGAFAKTMSALYPKYNNGGITLFRRALDGIKLYDFVSDAAQKLTIIADVNKLIQTLPKLAENCRTIAKIAEAYPDSVPGKTCQATLDSVELDKIYGYEATIAELKAWISER